MQFLQKRPLQGKSKPFIILTKTVNQTCLEMCEDTESVIRDTDSFVNTWKANTAVPEEGTECVLHDDHKENLIDLKQ